MQKITVRGIPLHVDDRRIVVKEDDAICTYSRDYYRLPLERDGVLPSTPVRLEFVQEGHGILVPAIEGR
ncbi:MAG: hypothetical protein BLM47_00220 [Candidatus Reconcilbacillus cellulovorans]|uniref:Uncharacterized protein n=1 Tax=Candidatus Reconcilbacillus cellulovorans TaxID=1906605 RepID=A0A2A6E447_9BACL|nr:MAG: hypothetical protein BLM47_00220 [Candidatus Reconcilbacillus cellulovorans]